MALKKCKECGGEVSSKAAACPKCGAKIVRTSGCAWLVLILFGLLVIPPILTGVNKARDRAEGGATPAAPTPKELSPADREAIRAAPAQRDYNDAEIVRTAKEAVRNRLKDPNSAQFKDVQFGDSTKTGPAAFGWVNSKNAMGGYTGFQRFVSNGKTTLLEEEVGEARVKEAWWQLVARETTVWPSVLDNPAVPVVVDVKTIIGKSEAEVAKILGTPKANGKVDNWPEMSYRDDKITVDFVRGKAAWITVFDLKNVAFAPSALGAVGLKATTPTFGNANIIRWEPYDKYHYVGIFLLADGKVDHIYIEAVAK